MLAPKIAKQRRLKVAKDTGGLIWYIYMKLGCKLLLSQVSAILANNISNTRKSFTTIQEEDFSMLLIIFFYLIIYGTNCQNFKHKESKD